MEVDILPDTDLPAGAGTRSPSSRSSTSALSAELARQVNRPFWLDTVGNSLEPDRDPHPARTRMVLRVL
jgi:two-component system osmolarity sensor histidine kinase EnvZ